MSEISVGSAVGAGFGLITRRPLSVLTWGLLRVGFLVAFFAIYAPTLISMITEITQQAQTGSEGQPSQAAVASLMSHMFLLQGIGLLAQIVGLFVSSMIICAVARAVVHPERRAFASLRLGAPEFFIVILSFGLSFALAFCLIIVLIPFAIATAFLIAGHQYVAAAIVVGLGVLVLLIGGIYIAARFAFVVPMMVDDGRFHLFDAWSLTKGRVGGIVLIGLCLFLIAVVLGLILDIVFVGLGAAALGMAAGGLDHLQTYFTQTPPQQIIMSLAPSLILLALLTIPIEGCALAIFFAPWARAYRDVVPATPAAQVTPPAPAQPLAAAP
jgi:hypothetical protein